VGGMVPNLPKSCKATAVALVRAASQNGCMSTDPNATTATPTPIHARDDEPSGANLLGGLLAGTGSVLAFTTLFYKPLLVGTIAVVLIVLGSLADGQPSRIGRVGMWVAFVCIFIGMLVGIFLTKSALW
ncbi:MAG: hypothetical protein JWO69_889, partial [Thermoleophilia bacterium]|nr:hypothetical protein [Thermoleophilia bacterium]